MSETSAASTAAPLSAEVPAQIAGQMGIFERAGTELDRIVLAFLTLDWSSHVPQGSGPADSMSSLVWHFVVGLFGILVALRFIRWSLFALMRGVSHDILSDEELCRLGRKRWVEMMTALIQDPSFSDETWKALMTEDIQQRLQSVMIGLPTNKEFVEGSAEFIRNLTAEESLLETFKAQITETLQDEHLHKAIIHGWKEAWKPDWIKGLQPSNNEPMSPTRGRSVTTGWEGLDGTNAAKSQRGLRSCG